MQYLSHFASPIHCIHVNVKSKCNLIRSEGEPSEADRCGDAGDLDMESDVDGFIFATGPTMIHSIQLE